MKKYLYNIIFLLLIPISVLAKTPLSKEELEQNYNTLKQALESHKESAKNLEDKLSNKIDALENKNLIVSIVSIIGVMSIVVYWFSIPKIVHGRIHKEIEQQFLKHTEFFSKMIEEFRNSVDIRHESKILILTTKNYTDPKYFLNRLLKNTGFYIFRYASPSESIEYKNFDCILFDNDNSELTEEFMLNVFSSAGTNLAFIYYNTTDKRIKNDNLRMHMNYANSKYQIYGNLMNTLITHKVLINR